MMELVVFAIVLTVAQLVGALLMMYIMFKVTTNKKFIVKYMKEYIKMMSEVTEELDDDIF